MLSSLLLATSLISSVTGTPLQPDIQQYERPRDIWVFRSVLDKHARMATIALDKDLYVAYDATYCGLYKAWTGGVKLEGAVYTTVHGPQPTSQGKPYIQNNPEQTTWLLDGQPVEPQFKGYSFKNKQVTLHYVFSTSSGKEFTVDETPEVIHPDQEGTIGLRRTFVTNGIPQGATLMVGWNVDPQTQVGKPKTNGKFFPTEVVPDWDATTLVLNHGTTNVDTIFKLPADWMLTAQFADLQANLRPSLPLQDQDQGKQDVSDEREPGLSLRVYYVGNELQKIPELIPGQTPNYSVIVKTVDSETAEWFGNFAEMFYASITGFVVAPEAGKYEFRLSSDDGGRLFINDAKVIESDKLQGMDENKTGSVALKKGENAVKIEMFQNTGGIGVRLEWKKPGDSDFSVVPAANLVTPAGEVRVTAPGKKMIFGQLLSRPGDRRPLESVHPAYDLTTIHPEGFNPRVGGIDFLDDGRMVICTWDPDGAVYLIDNYLGPRSGITVKRIAAGLAEPLGVKVVDNEIYILQKQELTKLKDVNGDDIIDEYICVANGWGVTDNFHEFCFGLVYEKGKFYATLATAINPGGSSTYPQNPDRGKVIEIDGKTGEYRLIASGLRTPNGVGRGVGNRIFIADNQGDWLPSSKILLLEEGAFYGNRSVDPEGTANKEETPPVVWLPQNEIGNSPSQMAPLNDGPYKGQMVHGDVTHGGLKRVFTETIDGRMQGVVFRFIQGLEAGINRTVVGPDGAFYVGGIGSTGNWGQIGKASFGLQRLAFNGEPVFEMLAVRSRSNGFEIEFTQPLALGLGEDPNEYEIKMWHYIPTKEYGGPKIDEITLPVKSVSVLAGRKKVFLEIPGLQEKHVVYLRIHPSIRSESGQPAWTTEAWYTLTHIADQAGQVNPVHTERPSKPTQKELADGFRVLFDGSGLSMFRGYNLPTLPPGWEVKDGAIYHVPGVAGSADLQTKEQFGDFELRFQFKVAEGANSGVIYRNRENEPASYMTGVEFQILDNVGGLGGDNPFTQAGAAYALVAPTSDATRPVGDWNDARIIAKGTKVEHWINGVKIVEYDTSTDLWQALVENSKFSGWNSFGTFTKGHIAFQAHGHEVAYRNIRIKELK